MDSPQPGPRVRGADGVELATYHYGGDGPPVMLLHATGFHGRGWIPLAPALTDRFNVWSVDQRGHGSSGKAPSGRYDDWQVFVDDLFAVLDALDLDGWRGFGHSLGGAVLLLSELRRPGSFASLCCYEPVVIPPTLSPDGFGAKVPMSEIARKRRAHFPSYEAAEANFASKPPMNSFHPDALHAYVRYGFEPDPAGGVTLACTGPDEASVYEGAPKAGVWDRLGDVRPPVLVVGGIDQRDPVSRIVEDVARHLPRGGARRFEHLSHFGPFEDPLTVGAVAAEALASTAAVAPPH